MKRIVVLGAGESGTGAAILAKEKGMDVFVSDMGAISPMYQALLDQHQIAWESGKHTPDCMGVGQTHSRTHPQCRRSD